MNTYAQICVARLLTGLGIGATSGLVPVFQAEAAPPKYRGLVTGSFQLCVTLGIWGVSMTNWGMSSYSGDVSWRIPVSLQMVWSALLLVGFVLSPESPRFLAKKGRWEECRKNLANLRGLPANDPEIDVSKSHRATVEWLLIVRSRWTRCTPLRLKIKNEVTLDTPNVSPPRIVFSGEQ